MNRSAISYNSPGTVSAVFFSKKDADKAYKSLIRRGHTPDDISVLMSDETLNIYENPSLVDAGTEEEKEPDSALDKAKIVIAEAIISVTSMISLPGLGIAISNTWFKRIAGSANEMPADRTAGSYINSRIPDEHTDSYGESMKEGGIIISVDPKNKQEKRDIVKDFKENNGHDILGDDGYTELD
ncbi:hypothetical protein [Dyadobacter sp. NIV53]|uniref:hypothetical protein n=1 Tax=Dyadobacter sp. NIV53 TaxID=2861765 RepID=UPI001C87BE01|nr:hypothetical protein [Dyadobacter sp. NIV53]